MNDWQTRMDDCEHSRATREAVALAKAGNFGSRAVEVNRKLLDLDPDDIGALKRLGRCYEEGSDLENAEQAFLRVLQIDPRNIGAKNHLNDIGQARAFPGVDLRRILNRPVPEQFEGFDIADFAELGRCSEAEIVTRFGPRVNNLIDRLNATSSMALALDAMLGAGARRRARVFSPSNFFSQSGHWYVFHRGGRWEPQLNFGMFSAIQWPGNFFRVGIGFNLSRAGRDPNPEAGQKRLLAHFERFRAAACGPFESSVKKWLMRSQGALQFGAGGPRLDLSPTEVVQWLHGCKNPLQVEWIFVGRWFSVARQRDAEALSSAEECVDLMGRTFEELLPLWTATYDTTLPD